VVSNAERRALIAGEAVVVPRVADVYAAMPSITGKFELEYEGELRGAETVAKDLIRNAVLNVSAAYFRDPDARQVVRWFDAGGSLHLSDTTPAREIVDRTREVSGLHETVAGVGLQSSTEPDLASAIDFALEALCAQKKISRSDDWRYVGSESSGPRRQTVARRPDLDEDDIPMTGSKKKYYN
jgi:magnesium chelatase subunit I